MSRLPINVPLVARRRCLRMHHAGSQCDACVRNCSTRALRLLAGQVALVAVDCSGCGACASVCPGEVFVFCQPGEKELLKTIRQAARKHGMVRIACTNARSSQADVEVACLHRLALVHFATACEAHADRVTLVTGDCEHCPRQSQIKQFEVITKARRLFTDLHQDCVISIARTSDRVDLRRRFFFSRAAVLAAPNGDVRNTRVVRDFQQQIASEPFKRVPESHREFVSALTQIAKKNLGTCGPDFLMPGIDVKKCTACSLCASSCPTGAMRAEKRSNNRLALMLETRACTSCGLCSEICYTGALELHRVPFTEVMHATRRELICTAFNSELYSDDITKKVKEFTGIPIYRS